MPRRSIIERFLSCDRIALVGASRNPKALANSVYRHLGEAGHAMVPVNSQAGGTEIEGDRCYARLADIPGAVDAVYVIVPAAQMAAVVDEAVVAGVKHVWLHRGAGQPAVPVAAVARAVQAGVEVVDGACVLMFAEPVTGIHRLHRVLIRRRLAA